MVVVVVVAVFHYLIRRPIVVGAKHCLKLDYFPIQHWHSRTHISPVQAGWLTRSRSWSQYDAAAFGAVQPPFSLQPLGHCDGVLSKLKVILHNRAALSPLSCLFSLSLSHGHYNTHYYYTRALGHVTFVFCCPLFSQHLSALHLLYFNSHTQPLSPSPGSSFVALLVCCPCCLVACLQCCSYSVSIGLCLFHPVHSLPLRQCGR